MAVLSIKYIHFQVIGTQTDSSCAARCREQGIDYFRLDPELKTKVNSDENDSMVLQEMTLTTRQYLHSKKDVLDRLVQMLMESELTST